ncbi:MAG: peroxiredoxin [Bacteroidetes bacterium]|nr:peroxiredoxin [Bacteroidota bacterium]
MLQVGDQAPDFTGLNQEKNRDAIQLSDFIGQRVTLYFFPKSGAYGCKHQACGIRDHWQIIQELLIVVIGVSGGHAKSHQKFVNKHDLPFPIVTDTDKKIMDLYGVRRGIKIYGKTWLDTIRTTFMIDESGKIVEVIKVPDFKNHGQEILDFWSSYNESSS